MDDWIDIKKDAKHIARERKKAKDLRNTKWWQEQLDRGICHFCGEKFSPEDLTMDHLVPVSRGGKSTKGNITACCKECNNEKKYLTPAEMIMRQMEKEEKLENRRNSEE